MKRIGLMIYPQNKTTKIKNCNCEKYKEVIINIQ